MGSCHLYTTPEVVIRYIQAAAWLREIKLSLTEEVNHMSTKPSNSHHRRAFAARGRLCPRRRYSVPSGSAARTAAGCRCVLAVSFALCTGNRSHSGHFLAAVGSRFPWLSHGFLGNSGARRNLAAACDRWGDHFYHRDHPLHWNFAWRADKTHVAAGYSHRTGRECSHPGLFVLAGVAAGEYVWQVIAERPWIDP